MFEAPLWALRFYRQHWPVVLPLMAIAAVERFTGQLWERPPLPGLLAELVTLAARIALFGYALRIAWVVGGLAHWWRGVRIRAAGLLVQALLVSVLFVLADVVPENVVPSLIDVGPLYMAFLLGIKNLTVIPFTMLWLIGIHRWVMLAAVHQASSR